MKKIDLRSDTVTHPSREMREAMGKAEVGDDVFGEDPTVNRLEELAASMTGKEAALFVSSGSMGNLVSLLAHCNRGDEIILGDRSHIHIHEQGGVASLGGIHSKTVRNQLDGTLNINEIEALIQEDDIHHAITKLICLENTWYGRVLPLSYMEEVRELADQHNLQIHLDGARLFNAAVALDVPAPTITQHVDTVQFCLSKGLASPIGSMVCGPKDFIAKARRARKLVGGGTRQAGVIASCGIISLKSMVDRLGDDHANAKLLAELAAKINGIEVAHVETNMVFLKSKIKGVSDRKLSEDLNAAGMLVFDEPVGIRCVTHFGIEESDIKDAVQIIQTVRDSLEKSAPVRR